MRTIQALVAIAVCVCATGCTLEDGAAPTPTGPSEFGLSVTLSATPDQLPRDGSSQASVRVVVRDDQGRPKAGQRLTLVVSPGTATLSQTDVTTDSAGNASVMVTAPPSSALGNTITIGAVPVGTNFSNTSPTRTVSIALLGVSNTELPTPAFDILPLAPEVNQSVRFDASGTRDEQQLCLDACTYHWDFGDGSTTSGRIVNHTFTAARTYTVILTVTDAAGTTASIARSIVVAAVPAPTVTLAVVPNPPLADQRATFTATATAATGHSITSYTWDFGDGTTQTTSTRTATKTYSTRGTYIVTVTVTDDLGQTGTASMQFTITGAGVTASFTASPSAPLTGQAVQFNGSASTGSAGATITEWAWDFGDGATSTETDPTTAHTYGAAGTYIVRLTVTDSAGRTGTTTTQVAVTDP